MENLQIAEPSGLNAFDLGPDGNVYTFYDDLLVRINPETLTITALSRVGATGFIAFSGKDIYLSGETRFRRVRGE